MQLNYFKHLLCLVVILVLMGVNAVSAQTTSETTDGASNSSKDTTASTTAKPKPQGPDQDKWEFQITPYIWIAGISGRAGIGALTADVDAGITDDDVDLNFGFMGTFEARKNRLVILTDLQYSDLGTDRATPGPLFTSANADFQTFVLDPEIGYRVAQNPEKGRFLDVLGGIRYWHLRTNLDFTPGIAPAVSATASKQWVDAVGGLRGRMHLTPKLFLTGKLDLGGGGSEFTYQLFGGVGIVVSPKAALFVGYRHLDVNYNRDGFLFDTALAGPILGVGFRF
jgi:hypothetical protein